MESGYIHTGLDNGATYYYVVVAIGEGGESPASNQAVAQPQPLHLGAPTGLGADAGDSQATLSWDDVAGATGYNLYWSTDDTLAISAWAKLPDVESGFTHTGLSNGTTYYYVVTALGDFGESAASNKCIAVPLPPRPVITGLADSDAPAKAVSWTWSSDDPAAMFRFAIDGSPAATEEDLGAWSSAATASISTGDGLRYLHVQAKNAFGLIGEIITVRAVLDNTAPGAFAVTVPAAGTDPRPTWSWSANADRVTYRASLDDSSPSEWTILGSATSFVPPFDLAAGSHALYVQASDAAGNWSASSVAVIELTAAISPWSVVAGTVQSKGVFYSASAAISGTGVVAAGRSTMAGGTSGYDAIAAAYDEDGAAVWIKTYGRSDAGNYDAFYSSAAVSDGYLFAGTTFAFGTQPGAHSDALIVKTDADGDVIWAKAFGQADVDEYFYGFIPVSDGILAVGYRDNDKIGVSAFIVKLDSFGTLAWAVSVDNTYPSLFRKAWSALELSDGYLIGGDTNNSTGGWRESWIFKLAKADGSLAWQTQLDLVARGTPAIQSLVASKDGSCVWGVGTDEYDVIAVPLNPSTGGIASGKSAIIFSMGSAQFDSQAQAAGLDDGGLLLTSTRKGTTYSSMWAARVSSSGSVVWQKIYGGATSNATGSSAAQGSNGRIYVVGSGTDGTSADPNCWILSPDADTGDLGELDAAAPPYTGSASNITMSVPACQRTSRTATTVTTDITSVISVKSY